MEGSGNALFQFRIKTMRLLIPFIALLATALLFVAATAQVLLMWRTSPVFQQQSIAAMSSSAPSSWWSGRPDSSGGS